MASSEDYSIALPANFVFNSFSTGGGSGGGGKDVGTRRALTTSSSVRKRPLVRPSKLIYGARDGGGEAPACSEYEADPKGGLRTRDTL